MIEITRRSGADAQRKNCLAKHNNEKEKRLMADTKTYKKVEIVGVSEKSLDDAIANAVKRASETLHNLDWFEVQELRGYINDNKPVFQVTVKIGFRLDEKQSAG